MDLPSLSVMDSCRKYEGHGGRRPSVVQLRDGRGSGNNPPIDVMKFRARTSWQSINNPDSPSNRLKRAMPQDL